MMQAARISFDTMQEIAEESGKQARSIDGISGSVRTLREMTVENVNLVEQTNATIARTESQVDAVDQLVELFKVVEAEDGSGSRRDIHLRRA